LENLLRSVDSGHSFGRPAGDGRFESVLVGVGRRDHRRHGRPLVERWGRERPVMTGLWAPTTAEGKEVAAELMISVHTVRDNVKVV